MRFIIRKKKKTNECDSCDCGQAVSGGYDFDAALGCGMGPVNPIGGPDKFGPIIGGFGKPRKRKYKVNRRRNG